MKQVKILMMIIWWIFLSLSSWFVFANDESVCVHRPYRINAPSSLDIVDDFSGTARLSLEQRIDFIGNTWTKESIGHERDVDDQSFQEQFCSEYIVVLMGTADETHLSELDWLTWTQFEKDTRFASCTFVNLVPNQERADVVLWAYGEDHYLYERTKYLIDTPESTALETFFNYPSAFEWRESNNTTYPYFMIIGQNGRVVEDGNNSSELLQEMQGYCRSYDCDGVVTNSQLPSDAEIDVDNDGLANDDEGEFDIDGDNQANTSNTERHARGDIDGDGAKNLYDMDIDCDGIPNDQDSSPWGPYEAPEECGDGNVDIGQTETCDDGNEIDTDECTNVCKQARCGDGIVWAWVETCDDGNSNNGDGCSNSCKSETCGDGILQRDFEECDDGNQASDDGCSECIKDPWEEDSWWEDSWEADAWEEDSWEADAWEEDAWWADAWEEDAWEEDAWWADAWEEDAWWADAWEGELWGNPTSGTNTWWVDGNVDGGNPWGNPTSGTNTWWVDGNIDAGSTDSGSTDNGNTDDGNTDEGNTDDWSTDDGNIDGGDADAGNTNAGSVNDPCKDESANNTWWPLPCTYDTCRDPSANNTGLPSPCTYDEDAVCEDESANNLWEPLPCIYDLCEDVSANNTWWPLPCTYDEDVDLPFPIWGGWNSVAGNTRSTNAGGNWDLKGLTCAVEYGHCLTACLNSWNSWIGNDSSIQNPWLEPWLDEWGGSDADGLARKFASGLVYAQSTGSCEDVCDTKKLNCENCLSQAWWTQNGCACKHFDHIYLNTDIPFIGQCILKRPTGSEAVSTSNLPNLDTAFPRLVSGISRLLQSLILVLGFMAIVIAGFMMSAWGMSPTAKDKWKNILKWVVVALILLWASWIILNLINPNFFITQNDVIQEKVDFVERNRERNGEIVRI